MAYNYQSVVDNIVIPQIRDKGVEATLIRRFPVDDQWTQETDQLTFEVYWVNNDTGEIVYTEPLDFVQEYTGKVLVTEYSEEERLGTSILRGDRKILTIELPQPIQGDVFRIRGIDYVYVTHNVISPGDTNVLYKIQVRV